MKSLLSLKMVKGLAVPGPSRPRQDQRNPVFFLKVEGSVLVEMCNILTENSLECVSGLLAGKDMIYV